MKKNIIVLIFFLIFAFSGAFPALAVAPHTLGVTAGGTMPPMTDINNFYGVEFSESINVYNAGLEYNYSPVGFLSLGIGAAYNMKGYQLTVWYLTDTFNLNAIEPYGVLRLYVPITRQIDAFIGGGGGYLLLMGSKRTSGTAEYTLEGSALTTKGMAGVSYTQGKFSTVFEAGYKMAEVSPIAYSGEGTSGNLENNDGSAAMFDFGGLYFNVIANINFGAAGPEDKKGKGYTKEAGLYEGKEEPAAGEKAEESAEEAVVEKEIPGTETIQEGVENPEETTDEFKGEPEEETGGGKSGEKEDEESRVVIEAEESYAAQTEQEAGREQGGIIVDREADDTDGIIILSPGQSGMGELEKYIVSKRKEQAKKEFGKEKKESESEITFDYEEEDAGLIVVETQAEEKIEKAGYVLVERGGFITPNFKKDGYIYGLNGQKLLVQNDTAYIKMTVGKDASKGREFIIYDDSEEVIHPADDRYMGRLIKIVGLARVLEKINTDTYRVRIKKSYDIIRDDFKVKQRSEVRNYHRKVTSKLKKKEIEGEGFIIRAKGDKINIQNKDVVYIDIGIKSGVFPGDRLGIYRKNEQGEEETEEDGNIKEHLIGEALIINSMQASSVAVVTGQKKPIKAGDAVKPMGK